MSAPITNTAECYDPEPGPTYDFEDVEMPERPSEPDTDPALLATPAQLRESAAAIQRGIYALQGQALTVCANRDPYVQRAVIEALTRRGCRAWAAGSGVVVALGEDESLALDALETRLAESQLGALARGFDLALAPLSPAQGATLTEAAA